MLAHAADLRYVKTPDVDLNVRQGPGTEHPVLARLPHGSPVAVQERVGSWLRIESEARGVAGWVLQRYLVTEPPGAPAPPGGLDPDRERQRFDRLQRKYVIRVRPVTAQRPLRITINALVWKRLTHQQQSNFLERAHRLYNTSVVEMRDHRTNTLLSRLTATGDNAFNFESLDRR